MPPRGAPEESERELRVHHPPRRGLELIVRARNASSEETRHDARRARRDAVCARTSRARASETIPRRDGRVDKRSHTGDSRARYGSAPLVTSNGSAGGFRTGRVSGEMRIRTRERRDES